MQLLNLGPMGDQPTTPSKLRIATTRAELALLRDVIATARDEIDREEFETRLGVDAAEADAIQTALAAIGSEAPRVGSPRESDANGDPSPTGQIVVGMTENELLLINNALNEVLNGLAIADVTARFGADRGGLEALLDSVGAIVDTLAADTAAGSASGNPYFDRLR